MSVVTSLVIENCKRAAATHVVDKHVKDGFVIGVGSGSTIKYALERIKYLVTEKQYKLKCIPTSYQSKQLIRDLDLVLTDLSFHPSIDIAIDGADEVDSNLVAIKGGGGCLAQEKVVASSAKEFYVVADYQKNSSHLGHFWKRGVPIEVLPMAVDTVKYQLCKILDTDTSLINVRQALQKAGPVVTDNGNFIIDWRFDANQFQTATAMTWLDISNKIKLLPGVLETGIFSGFITEAYFGQADGSITTRK